ncbi:MAG: hypothetical protein ASARMPRED_001131 [Alectoria sarmentosa]|nr:MAG: hypothetical protein ASARMPRED_001131 [Alectoria sarmentosa]
MVNDNAARLLLTPPYDRKHNVFPVSMLKISAVAEPGSVPDRPQPGRKAFLRLDEDGEPLWEAEKIMDERIIKKDQKTYRHPGLTMTTKPPITIKLFEHTIHDELYLGYKTLAALIQTTQLATRHLCQTRIAAAGAE